MKNSNLIKPDSGATFIKLFLGGFGIFWVISALAGATMTGLIIYILYRVAIRL